MDETLIEQKIAKKLSLSLESVKLANYSESALQETFKKASRARFYNDKIALPMGLTYLGALFGSLAFPHPVLLSVLGASCIGVFVGEAAFSLKKMRAKIQIAAAANAYTKKLDSIKPGDLEI